MITALTHSLVSTPSTTVWSQSQSVKKENALVGIVVCLSIQEDVGLLDLASVGGAYLAKITDLWEKDSSNLEWLVGLRDDTKEIESRGIKIDVVGYQLLGSQLMLWGSGKMKGYLWREGELAMLGDSTTLVNGVKGEVRPHDMVLLANEQVYEGVGLDQISEILTDEGSFEDSLAPLIYKNNDSSGNVAQVLKVEEVEDQTTQEGKGLKRWQIPYIRIQRMSEEPKKFNLIFGTSLVVGLIILVLVGIVTKTKKQASLQFETAINAANQMVNEAKSVAENNPERAKILLAQASETVKAYIAKSPKKSFLDQANNELSSIESSAKEILRVRGIELSETVELSLLNEGLSASRFESDGNGNIYFWDEGSKNIIGFNLKDASSTKFAVKEATEMGAMAVAKNGFFGVVPGGIWQGSANEQKVVIERDELWGQIGQIGFFGSNVYLLDLGNGEIWKYSAVEGGYAERKRWFGAGIVLDLSKIVDWVVDGDIWLLSSSGKLERYSRGVPTNFALTGFPSLGENGGLVEPRAIVVNEEMIYVLESGASRVVAFDIEGKYRQQYVSSDFARASDIVINENRGYVLIENVVKEWEL